MIIVAYFAGIFPESTVTKTNKNRLQ